MPCNFEKLYEFYVIIFKVVEVHLFIKKHDLLFWKIRNPIINAIAFFFGLKERRFNLKVYKYNSLKKQNKDKKWRPK